MVGTWLGIRSVTVGQRRAALAAAMLVAALVLIPLVGAPRAGAHQGDLDTKALKKQIARRLTAAGYDVKQILPCRKRGPSKYRCQWRVTGTYTDGPDFSCRGFATYLVNGHKLRLDPCFNALLWDLLIEKGLKPKAILNGRFKSGVWRAEWRAEGTGAGEVPYRCKNVARYQRRKHAWTLGACDNDIAPAEPLLDQPGPRPVFGFNDDWIKSGILDHIGMATAVGATVVRFNISWAQVEPQPDRYVFTDYDPLIARMVRAGTRPLIVVDGAPCWAQSGNCDPVGGPGPAHVDDFAEFMATVAAHYSNLFPGSPPFALEVWNEPNWDPFFAPKPDVDTYAAMIRMSASAVHAAAPGVPVVVAGMAPLANSDSDGSRISSGQFLKEIFQHGGIGSADAMGAHIYFGPVSDYTFNMRQQIASIRNILANNGAGSLPIWITEYGVSSTEETDEQGQGKVLVDLYNTFRRIANIPVVILHRFVEGQETVFGGIDHRGIVDKNFKPKPAYCDIAHATDVVPKSC